MRITNKIMQNNTLYNINNNKILQDKLNTQMTTRKKIIKPSDDPVIAIRALRLRSNLNQVSQYNERNIPDAEHWIELTESAVSTTVDLVGDMIEQFQKGSKSSYKTSDREILLQSLKQLREEVYATGDADYAGRTIFTGYRTDMKLSFDRSEEKTYRINEQLTNVDTDTITYLDYGDVGIMNETNFNDPAMTSQQEVQTYQVNRIRLAYENLDPANPPTIQQTIGYEEDGTPMYASLGDVQTISINDAVDAYRVVSDPDYANYDADAIIFVPETGELLLGENAYNKIKALPVNAEIVVSYDKTQWIEGDLRPEHYFACEADGLAYNPNYLTRAGRNEKQVISYDVGFNQDLQVNTTADEVYKHGIGREVDELIRLLEQMEEIDLAVEKISALEGNGNYDADAVETALATAEKAQTYIRDLLQRRFERGITTMQGYFDEANAAYTAIGNRSLRLELIGNRLDSQMVSFQTLVTKNEDADLEDLAVQLSSSKLTYDAALAATGKLLQTTLMNYI